MHSLKALLRPTYNSLRKGRIRQIFHWVCKGHVIKKFTIQQYTNKQNPQLLQVGGGHYKLSGWINGDLIGGNIYLNATSKLPFKDNSIDRTFAEHFIEHITYDEAEAFLKDVLRIMKPGGKLRLATPDLEKICDLYRGENKNVDMQTAIDRHAKNHRRKILTPASFVNDLFRLWGHQFIYDYEAIETLLKNVGFEAVQRVSFGESADEHLQQLERHADSEWMKHAFQLIVEAQKPASK